MRARSILAAVRPMARPRLQPGHAPVRVAPLDPCTLGRPFHLLEGFLQRLAVHLDQFLQYRFNRRCGSRFRAGAAGIAACMPGTEADVRWRIFQDATGTVAVRLDRPLLLAMLGYHYGDAPGDAATLAEAPETETEHRFAASLFPQFLDGLAVCSGGAAGGFAAAGTPFGAGRRLVRIELHEDALGLSGRLELALDEAWLAHLFHHVAPARPPLPPSPDAGQPLQRRLRVTLHARIAARDIAFEELLRLRPGDILPIRPVGSADVLVEDVHLYRASVAEQGGMLCLTSFVPVE